MSKSGLKDIVCKNYDNIMLVLSGERLSQMTKTYDDTEALQKLLEEKEKDLELAARIGQQLLEHNQNLEEKIAHLEIENKECHESITQLKHDLSFKTQLLELYNENCSEEPSKACTPVFEKTGSFLLEKRVNVLETENRSLRAEACRIVEAVEFGEAEEKYLVDDAIKKLSESNSQLTILRDELERKTEENVSQQEEINLLIDGLKQFQEANKELVHENLQLNKLVSALKNSQDDLTTELADLKDNYMEVVQILKETQEQLREAQKRKESGADVVTVFDSLAYEIETSVARQKKASDYFRRTFDIVRCANTKMMDSSGLMSSTTSSIGYHSGLPSLESSHDIVLMNQCMSLTERESDLRMCPSNGSTPSDKYSWKMPEKLQIVKPIEGSSTLQIWSSLATPNLGTLLEKRPGIHMRVERPIKEIGLHHILSLTGVQTTSEGASLTTPTLCLVTTTTGASWDRDRGDLSTIYSSSDQSSNMSSTASTYSFSTSSCRDSPTPSCSNSVECSVQFECKCETPSNTPEEISRSSSPTNTNTKLREENSSNRTFKTLYSVYENLCSTFGSLNSNSSSNTNNSNKTTPLSSTRSSSLDLLQKPKKCDLMSKIGSIELAFKSSTPKAENERTMLGSSNGTFDKFLFGSSEFDHSLY